LKQAINLKFPGPHWLDQSRASFFQTSHFWTVKQGFSGRSSAELGHEYNDMFRTYPRMPEPQSSANPCSFRAPVSPKEWERIYPKRLFYPTLGRYGGRYERSGQRSYAATLRLAVVRVGGDPRSHRLGNPLA